MQPIPSLLRRLLPPLLLAAAAVAPGLARAAYPEQPIRMIVAYAAGGGTDIIARVIAPYIAKHLGPNASIVVLNPRAPAAASASPRWPARSRTATPSASSTRPTC